MLKQRPSSRLNRRYLLVDGSREGLEKAILDYIGILGWAKAAPFFKKAGERKWIVAINREEIVNVRAAFALSEGKISVRRVSGTLKGLGIKK